MKKYLFPLAVLLFAPITNADDWKQDRSQGKLCEQPSGYIKAKDTSLNALATQLNAQRRRHYQQTAQNTGAAESEVAAVAGQQLSAEFPC